MAPTPRPPSMPSSQPSMPNTGQPQFSTDEIASLIQAGQLKDPITIASMMQNARMSGGPSMPTTPEPAIQMPSPAGATPETQASTEMPLAATTEVPEAPVEAVEPVPMPEPMTTQDRLEAARSDLIAADQNYNAAADNALAARAAIDPAAGNADIERAEGMILGSLAKSQSAYDSILLKNQEASAKAQAEYDTVAKDSEQTFWGSMSTGNKVLAAISLALGAYAEGLSQGKQKSGGARILEQMAQDWARAQGQKVANAKEKLNSVQEAYKNELEITKNKQAAELNLQNAFLDAVGKNATRMAATQKQKAELAVLQEQLAETKRDNKAKMYDLYRTQAKEEAKEEKADNARMIPGFGVIPYGGAEEIRDLRKDMAGLLQADALLAEIDKIRNSADFIERKTVSREDSARLGALGRAYIMGIKQGIIGGGNNITGAEAITLEKEAPNYDDIFNLSKSVDARIKGQMQSTASNVKNRAIMLGAPNTKLVDEMLERFSEDGPYRPRDTKLSIKTGGKNKEETTRQNFLNSIGAKRVD